MFTCHCLVPHLEFGHLKWLSQAEAGHCHHDETPPDLDPPIVGVPSHHTSDAPVPPEPYPQTIDVPSHHTFDALVPPVHVSPGLDHHLSIAQLLETHANLGSQNPYHPQRHQTGLCTAGPQLTAIHGQWTHTTFIQNNPHKKDNKQSNIRNMVAFTVLYLKWWINCIHK